MVSMNFLLTEAMGDSAGPARPMMVGRVEQESRGLGIILEGYGDRCSEDGQGACVYIELYNGVPRVVIWADITQEDPTHVIELDLAAESRLLPEE